MNINYIAHDSFGVKSLCTKVHTDQVITIDPGISAEAKGFPLPEEIKQKLYEDYKEKIKEATKESNIVIITHYHYDHHTLERDKRLYGNKILLIKDPQNYINKSQTKRADLFLKETKGLPKDVIIADGRSFKFGDTELNFTEPMWHGKEGTPLGYIIGVTIKYKKEKLLFASDVCGPVLKTQTDWIIAQNADISIIDGPPSYILGFMFSYENFNKSIVNLKKIIEKARGKIILDHHLMRDYKYPELLSSVYETAKKDKKVVLSAAEDMGEEPMVLSAYKKYRGK